VETGRSHIFAKLLKTGCVFICLACFFTPLSTSLLGLFSGLAVLMWLLSGNFLKLPHMLISYPSAAIALILFVLMCLALIYTPVEPPEALDTLKKYRELLLLPVMLSLLTGLTKYQKIAENSFVAGCIILMLLSYGMFFEFIPEQRYGHSLVFHITHSFFMAVLSFWALHRAVSTQRLRYFWLIIYLATVVNIFYIAPGRTGMFVFVFLMVLFLIQRFTLIQCIFGLLVFCSVLTLFYITSDNFSGRIHEVVKEIKTYEQDKSITSIGQRFDWWVTSFELIKKKPVLGYGTGSFSRIYEQTTKTTRVKSMDNPHNEYIFITFQVGVIGLFLFLMIFLLQFLASRSLPTQKGMLLQGVLVAMLSGSLMNSLLFDSQQGHFYLLMSATLMTMTSPKFGDSN
jgi:O-antigen ligase